MLTFSLMDWMGLNAHVRGFGSRTSGSQPLIQKFIFFHKISLLPKQLENQENAGKFEANVSYRPNEKSSMVYGIS